MTSSQKLIKYCAISLASLIIISIIVGVVSLANFFVPAKDSELQTYSLSEFKNLKVDIDAAEFRIVEDKEFKIEITENSEYEYNGDELVIISKHVPFSTNSEKIVLHMPSKAKINNFNFDGGAGLVKISRIEAENANIKIGTGDTEIDWIYVKDMLSLNGGAGNLVIKSGIINRIELDQGVGNVDVKTKILSSSKFNLGIGNFKLKLMDGINNYNFDIDKGLGNLSLDGKKVSGGNYGTGNINIKIDGGIGNIEIK